MFPSKGGSGVAAGRGLDGRTEALANAETIPKRTKRTGAKAVLPLGLK